MMANNRNDNHLENTNDNLICRLKHISLTINEMFSDNRLGKSINADKIAVIKYSMGGAGTPLGIGRWVPRTKEGKKVEVALDTRVKAIVLLAPETGWFINSLEKVTVLVLLFIAGHDPITPGWNADIVLKDVPDKMQVRFRKIENAGHFSFLSLFPNAMKNPNFLPSTAPEEFDREQYHRLLPVEIFEFLKEKL